MCACLAGRESFAGVLPGLSSDRHLVQAAANPPQKNPPQKNQSPPAQKNGNRSGQPARKTGEWLESHKNLPPDQQLKALESDPKFQKLPPDRQAALRERLRKFNSLPPEQRDRALQRMDFMQSLTHEQREQIRDANQKMQALPQDRRVAVHTALRHLRQMSPEQRQQVFASDRFRNTFSGQEQEILKQLATINPPFGSSSTFQPKSGASPSPDNGKQPK
jgi:phage-related protein